MRFLIINSDYPQFLDWFYSRNPGLDDKSYDEQMAAHTRSLHGVVDSYSSNLRKLGHEAWGVYSDNIVMQRAWAREHRLEFVDKEWKFRWRKKIVPWIYREQTYAWFYSVLRDQIMHYRPDILLNLSMIQVRPRFVREMKPYVRLALGQHAASPLSEGEDWTAYDMVLTSFLPTIEWFRKRDVRAELLRLGFDDRIPARILKEEEESVDVAFIGGISHSFHQSRIGILTRLAREIPLNVWGPVPPGKDCSPELRRCYRGSAWGEEMYRVLARSKIAINHHGSIPGYANNWRLYEATGMGALLITDWKQNLEEIFDLDKEVVSYRSPEECVEKVKYYLAHEDERKPIARAGQARTLREHTYHHRMQELIEIIRKQLD